MLPRRLLHLSISTLLCLLLVDCASVRRQNYNHEAIVRLSEVFGIDKLPVHQHHRAPPEYMLDLYNTVAYSDGITKSRSPYGSDVVRGLPDRATTHQMHFYFNVSYVHPTEKVLEAEFHLFKLRPRPPGPDSSTRARRTVHLIELRLYQVLDESRMDSPAGLKLVEARRLSAHKHGWEVFKVRDTIQAWVNNSQANHGFLATAQSLDGKEHLNGSYLRFAQRSEHHDSKQPVLVVFTEDHRLRQEAYLPPSESDLLTDYKENKQNRETLPSRRNYVQFLNERTRAELGHYRPIIGRNLQNGTIYNTKTVNKRPRRSLRRRSERRARTADYNYYPRKRKQRCSKQEMYVDFDEIGWSGWIISPKGYNAYHCTGECPFPLGQSQKPTNHATVQSIVHALRIGKAVGTPCCVPNKLYSISLLYFDDDENVILKQYDDMVAASCGCH